MAYASHGRGHGFQPIRSAWSDVAWVVVIAAATTLIGLAAFVILARWQWIWRDSPDPVATAAVLTAVIVAIAAAGLWFARGRWLRRQDWYLDRHDRRSMSLLTAASFDLLQSVAVGAVAMVLGMLAQASADGRIQRAGIIAPIAVVGGYFLLSWLRVGLGWLTPGRSQPRGWWARAARVMVHWTALVLGVLPLALSSDPQALVLAIVVCGCVTFLAGIVALASWTRGFGGPMYPEVQDTLAERWLSEQTRRRR
ncbi:hypothetical protein [Parenemella sanctibonifatiensis]|uniref:Uncharacterized protein n=1 Tax=Parenemella sanctibonifatiensis TaxID=2016505 RepID=A0A255E4N8_9ACTN|nr:hypothetical protein [Parenemella sanctibonifatiensis]OYN86514.1 hypothetical protein CGZ92_09235 [Parenemella sanctibonifatiensis]